MPYLHSRLQSYMARLARALCYALPCAKPNQSIEDWFCYTWHGQEIHLCYCNESAYATRNTYEAVICPNP